MGLQLPPELIEALSYVGCTWPEADETKLMEAGQAWLAFAGAAAGHAGLAVTAVDSMVGENTSQGITAFAEYWEKVAGEGGYLANSRIVATAVALAFFQAAILVLSLKLLVIAQLIAFAVILAAAVAAAFFTLGASLAAAAEAAVAVNRAIVAATRITITAVRELGPVLAELAREHLSEKIDRLEGRPIHSSDQGVDSFDTPAERAEAEREYQRRMEELAFDPAHGGASEGTRREAEVALGLEATGTVDEPVERAAHPGADFTDGSGQDWDVKGFRTVPGRPGTYDRGQAERSIQRELRAGENVALDTSQLSRADFDDLKDLVASHPDWANQVVIY
jgi:hypothetical protein